MRAARVAAVAAAEEGRALPRMPVRGRPRLRALPQAVDRVEAAAVELLAGERAREPLREPARDRVAVVDAAVRRAHRLPHERVRDRAHQVVRRRFFHLLRRLVGYRLVALPEADERRGSFAGFFVAPKAASYVFVGVWDAALELSLSATSDPRHLQVILGGATQTPPANNDVVGGWTFFDGHWYFASTETRNWADAQAACQAEGATLAEINSEAEQDFLYGLCDGVSTWQCWLGGSAHGFAGMWRWQSTEELFTAGSGDTVAAAPGAYTKWNSGQPDGTDVCMAM